MRIGLLGAGRIAAVHARACQRIPEVDTVVVADPALRRAKAIAAQIGLEAADSVDALFEQDLDGVVIASSSPTHAELLARTIEAGLPTLCEKPVTLDLDSTADLAAAAAARSVPVQVAFQRRCDPGYLEARRMVAAGELGALHSIRSSTFDPLLPSADYLRESGGIFLDCGVHDIDSIRWLTGSEVVSVSALGQAATGSEAEAVDDFETASAVLELANGCLAVVSLSRLNGAGADDRIELFGRTAAVTAGLTERVPLRPLGPGSRPSMVTPYPDFIDRFAAAFEQQMVFFVDVVAGRVAPPSTVVDSLRAMEVAFACETSARTGRRVYVEGREVPEPVRARS